MKSGISMYITSQKWMMLRPCKGILHDINLVLNFKWLLLRTPADNNRTKGNDLCKTWSIFESLSIYWIHSFSFNIKIFMRRLNKSLQTLSDKKAGRKNVKKWYVIFIYLHFCKYFIVSLKLLTNEFVKMLQVFPYFKAYWLIIDFYSLIYIYVCVCKKELIYILWQSTNKYTQNIQTKK